MPIGFVTRQCCNYLPEVQNCTILVHDYVLRMCNTHVAVLRPLKGRREFQVNQSFSCMISPTSAGGIKRRKNQERIDFLSKIRNLALADLHVVRLCFMISTLADCSVHGL